MRWGFRPIAELDNFDAIALQTGYRCSTGPGTQIHNWEDTVSNQALRTLIAAALMSLLPACSTLQGKESNGHYVAPDNEFSVMIPPVLDVDCSDGKVGPSKEYVDCSMGNAYWMVDGGYSVEWYRLEHPFDSDTAFLAETTKVLPSLVKGGPAPGFSVIQTHTLTINGRAAYQIVARGIKDKIDSFCIATSIDFGKRIAVAYLLIPVKSDRGKGPVDADQAVTWGYYSKFVDSIETNVTNP